MQIFLNLLNAKKIALEVNPVDTVETLKKAITEATGLPLQVQSLRLQNGTTMLNNGTRLCLGDLLKPGTLINLTYQQDKRKPSFYVNAVTVSGRVFTVNLEEGSATTIDKLRKQIASILGISVETLFLRVVDMSRFLNKSLVPFFNTLDEFSVGNGAVIYLQVHPCQESWYHGKISRDRAEQVMLSAGEGQFLVKESVNFPGDYVLFVCIGGQIKHYRVFCKKNLMFTVNDRDFFDSIEDMVKSYKNNRGRLPIKLTEPVIKSPAPDIVDGVSVYSWEAPVSDSTLPRGRLETKSSPEIQLQIVLGSDKLSLLTSPFNSVRTLKEQIAELSGVPVECQLLRLDDKPLVMDTFLVCDHHITDNSVVYVQVHPWNEEWYVGRMSAVEVDSLVSELTDTAEGMFLVRESISYPGDYVLYVWSKGKSRQFRVRNRKNLFTLDNKQQFNSLSQLVEYYKNHKGPLATRLHEPLKCNKEQRGLIPPAVLARGIKARAAYKRALEHGKTHDARVRVMLIGQDRAGKTSVKRSLKGEKFNKDEASTDGVEMDVPLLKAGVQAWKASQADEGTTVFAHRSAQMVARQLSRGSEEATEPSTEIRSPGLTLPCSPGIDFLSNGVQSPGDSPTKDTAETVSSKQLVEPASPFHSDEVFIADSQSSDSLPPEIVVLVEEILHHAHSDINEEIWPVIWDFAGQSLYHALHPVFMSREAVYLLVSDLSTDLFARAVSRVKQPGRSEHTIEASDSEETSLDHLMRWMDMVHALQDPTSAGHSDIAQPPVIIVGTHADKVADDPWKPINAILDSFRGKAFLTHVVEEQFVVDNTRAGQPFQQEDPNVHRLRQKILSVASTQPHTKREIPLQWLLVEKELQDMASKGVKHITKSDFKAISQRICQFQVEEDSDELLHFLNYCGAVLNFSEADHPDGLIILDPQWLIEAFCQIITVTSGKKEPMRIRDHRRTLAEDGILSEELIDYACQNLNLKNAKESLISIMEKSNLICKWGSESGGSVYLVPFMLTTKAQEEISNLTDKGSIGPIYLTFNSGYVPYGLFARLLALFGQWAKQKFSPRQPKLFQNVARFFIGEKSDFCVSFVCYKAVIRIDLLHEGESDNMRETNVVCRDVARCVEDSLEALREQCSWLRSMVWQLSARCDLCSGEGEDPQGCLWHHVHSCSHADCAHFIPLDSDPFRCYRTFKPNTFLRLDGIKPWIKGFHGRSQDQDQLPFKPGRVSPDDLLVLAHDLGKQWVTLCVHLLDERELEHIDHDEKTLLDKCYRMLTRWSGARGSDATYAALGRALNSVLERNDLCTKYCLISRDEPKNSNGH